MSCPKGDEAMAITDSDLSSFGVLLKFFRTRRHFTQQQLAAAIGAHRNAIGRWEQGNVLPQHRGIVLELARHLRLDDQEARRLLEASLTAPVPVWNVPFPRNAFFTGREEILVALHRALGAEQTVALTQSSALHGLGGVGKTQLALEYTYRYALEYSAVFWIRAETVTSIVSSLLQVAEVLQLPGRDDHNQQRVIAAVQRWLSTHGQWLLIWDNMEDLELLDRFLPSTGSGAVLITTRCQVLGTRARGIDLVPMKQEEGVLFVLRRAKVLSPEATREQLRQFAQRMPAHYAAAVELVSALGGLPLALDQAGAYLEETQCAFSAYLDLFRTRRAALLQLRGKGSCTHPESVSTTFVLAMTATAQHHPAVLDLLRVCAMLQADAIPEELFRQGGEHLGETLQAVCRDPLEWNQVVGVACAYSLLHRQPEEQMLSIHRLVQAVVLDAMTHTEREQWSKCVLSALDAATPEVFPHTEQATLQWCERLLPHILQGLYQASTIEDSPTLASLAYKAARYIYLCAGRYTEAQPLYQRALHIREQVFGPDHPKVAEVLHGLATLFWSQGNVQAEALYRRALAIWEQALEPEHLRVASTLNNLGILHWEQGRYEEAEALYRRALAIGEQALGPEHPQVAYPLNNLAELSGDQGRYEEAEALYQRALAIWEQALGPEHPQVAHPLTGLANLLREQGQYPEAQPLYQRALQIREQALGPEHPDTTQTLHSLAIFRKTQGHLSEAIPLARRALSIRSQALGESHPHTVATRELCARLVQEQAYAEVEAASKRCPEAILDRRCNEHHADRASSPRCEAGNPSPAENDPLQVFLTACCELHPRAWCRISDLWRAYEHWATRHQERFPLSRRAFAAQVQAHGCRADRTSAVRIWRGITLVKPEP
jgi:tetratricopeptide (TPR) repeat protein